MRKGKILKIRLGHDANGGPGIGCLFAVIGIPVYVVLACIAGAMQAQAARRQGVPSGKGVKVKGQPDLWGAARTVVLVLAVCLMCAGWILPKWRDLTGFGGLLLFGYAAMSVFRGRPGTSSATASAPAARLDLSNLFVPLAVGLVPAACLFAFPWFVNLSRGTQEWLWWTTGVLAVPFALSVTLGYLAAHREEYRVWALVPVCYVLSALLAIVLLGRHEFPKHVTSRQRSRGPVRRRPGRSSRAGVRRTTNPPNRPVAKAAPPVHWIPPEPARQAQAPHGEPSVRFEADLGTITMVAGPGLVAPYRGRAGGPFLWKEDDKWKMWFASDGGTDPGPGAICCAESDEGVTFGPARVLVSCSRYYQVSTPYVVASEPGHTLYYSHWYVSKCRQWAHVIKRLELDANGRPGPTRTVVEGTDQLGYWMGRQTYCPSVLRHDGQWLMVFNGQAWPPRPRDKRPDISLGITFSGDGKTWQKPMRLSCSDEPWAERASGPRLLPMKDGVILIYAHHRRDTDNSWSICYRTAGWDLAWSREAKLFSSASVEDMLEYPVYRAAEPFLIEHGDTAYLYFSVLKDKKRTEGPVWESSIYRVDLARQVAER